MEGHVYAVRESENEVITKNEAASSSNTCRSCNLETKDTKPTVDDIKDVIIKAYSWRRKCGCLRTSDKLKSILESFPGPPPPSPKLGLQQDANGIVYCPQKVTNTCISAYCANDHEDVLPVALQAKPPRPPKACGDGTRYLTCIDYNLPEKSDKLRDRVRPIIRDIATTIQFFIMTTALAFYYIIYCYMQLIYFALRSAVFFHQADGPMKITIGIVTATTLVVGFNLLIKMERLFGRNI